VNVKEILLVGTWEENILSGTFVFCIFFVVAVLQKNMIAKLKNAIERPLYNLWRIGMVVPPCFAVSFFVIHNMIFGGEEINTRSWYALASGSVIAIVALLLSRKLLLRRKVLFIALTILGYPVLCIFSMLIGALAGIFNGTFLVGTQ
jgi:hypothetical protein